MMPHNWASLLGAIDWVSLNDDIDDIDIMWWSLQLFNISDIAVFISQISSRAGDVNAQSVVVI